MNRFHITLHARDEAVSNGPPYELDGRTVPTLCVAGAQQPAPLPISFEEATLRLEEIPAMYVEPDGSFLWSDTAQRWRLEGNLYDRRDRLMYVELWGTCSEEMFDSVCSSVGSPETELMIQLTQHAVFLSQAEFKLHAFSE